MKYIGKKKKEKKEKEWISIISHPPSHPIKERWTLANTESHNIT